MTATKRKIYYRESRIIYIYWVLFLIFAIFYNKLWVWIVISLGGYFVMIIHNELRPKRLK